MLMFVPAQGGSGWFFCMVFFVAVGILVNSLRRSRRRCRRCAEANPRHARFCAQCGARLNR